MTEAMTELPQAESADPDGVQVALRAAHTLWSNGETAESLRWLRRAAESASDEGADLRSLQLAKAAAELRAKLVRSGQGNGGNVNGLSAANASPSEPPLSDRAVVTATQYPAQRHREAPRPLMGISSATLERVVQRESVAPGSTPAARYADDPKLPPEPPPLPDPFAADDASLQEAWPTPAPHSAEEAATPALSDPRTWSNDLPPEASARPLSQRPPPMPPPLPDAGITELEPLLYPAYGGSAGAPEDFDWPSAPVDASPALGPANEPRMSSSDSPERAPVVAPLTARVHHQAVRVALAPDPRSNGQFILRALREREVPQNGERVALLVALEPGTPLV